MKALIEVENLSKEYKLGGIKRSPYLKRFSNWCGQFINSKADSIELCQHSSQTIWALKNINFSVNNGSVLGIIGKNGSGKSTLLKILSRITTPTSGTIRTNGRITSLLEIGTGFHPELTGRDNIFLNGAILGMKRREIRSKFDEIVNFSGVEKFIDTPVKHYSSGMYVRLAFAVAAHLDPEILIVDEVLAVGDIQFQQHCLNKMKEVSAGQGRTILFVSHNMAAIKALCSEAIWIHEGKVCERGNVDQVVSKYLANTIDCASQSLAKREDRKGSGKIKINKILCSANSKEKYTFSVGESFQLDILFQNNLGKKAFSGRIDIGINNEMHERVAAISSAYYTDNVMIPNDGVSFVLNNVNFVPGVYTLTIYLEIEGEISDWVTNAQVIYIQASDFYRSDRIISQYQGHCLLPFTFHEL